MTEPRAEPGADVSVRLAAYTAAITYESLPSTVVSTLKRILLDTLGTTLAANTLGTGSRELVDLVCTAGGTPESTVLGMGVKVPAAAAALANGNLAHALNYDDAPGEGGGHLGVTSVPAALATAEMAGDVSGKELLAALAAGTELMARLGVAIARAAEGDSESRPQPTQMPGYFSAAASAGRVLRLTPVEMHSALGLALMQASGGRQPVLEGNPAKAIYAGFSNHGGTLSAQLSKRGLRADCAVLEGEAGLFKTYYHGRYFRAALADDLGERLYLLDVGFKPWPTTAVAHPYIEAALELRGLAGFDPLAIEAIQIRGGPHIRIFCEPTATRQRPATAVEAGDSIFFGVAKALVNGTVTLADLQPAGLRQPEALQLAARMRYSVDRELGRSGILEIQLASGQRHTLWVDTALGHPSKPLSQARLVEKFLDCAQYAATPIPKQSLEAAVDAIDHLERLPDVGVLPALLHAHRSGDRFPRTSP
jgi:2-methylcitrate dehydratase PrpD